MDPKKYPPKPLTDEQCQKCFEIIQRPVTDLFTAVISQMAWSALLVDLSLYPDDDTNAKSTQQ